MILYVAVPLFCIPCSFGAIALKLQGRLHIPHVVDTYSSVFVSCFNVALIVMFVLKVLLQRLVLNTFPAGDCEPYPILSLVFSAPLDLILLPIFRSLRSWYLLAEVLCRGQAGQVYQERKKTQERKNRSTFLNSR